MPHWTDISRPPLLEVRPIPFGRIVACRVDQADSVDNFPGIARPAIRIPTKDIDFRGFPYGEFGDILVRKTNINQRDSELKRITCGHLPPRH